MFPTGAARQEALAMLGGALSELQDYDASKHSNAFYRALEPEELVQYRRAELHD